MYYILCVLVLYLTILAGLPATTQLLGTSFTTIEPAPIITLSPIVIPPTTTEPV